MEKSARELDTRLPAHAVRPPGPVPRGTQPQALRRQESLPGQDRRELAPELVLHLQATAGNRAVAALLGRRAGPARMHRGEDPASPAPQLQRKTYLANQDEAIYADTARPGLELSYIDKRVEQSKWHPLFIEYEKVTPLKARLRVAFANYRQGLLEQARQAGTKPKKKQPAASRVEKPRRERRPPGLDESAYARQYFFLLSLDKVRRLLGTIYIEGPDGTLATTHLGDDSVRRNSEKVALDGPLVRPEGGGSRLPRAEGHLFSKTAGKDEAYDMLGIPKTEQSKYSNVQFHPAPRNYDAALQYFREQNANLVVYRDLFYVSTVTVQRSRNARFHAAGVFYDETFSLVVDPSPEKDALASSYASLTAPAVQDWQTGRQLGTTGREEGQVKAMGNWNALGVAAYARRFHGVDVPLVQNWEWLHIQGAQIGGVTRGGNLTPGLYVANSAMIPFEKLVKRLAQTAPGSDRTAPDRMAARFVPTWVLTPGLRAA